MTITTRTPTPGDIAEALARPSAFGYFGKLPLYDAPEGRKPWSLGPIIVHRDSGCIDRSNAEAIQAIFTERFGPPAQEEDGSDGRWTVTHVGHCMVGWADHLSFEVDDTPDGPLAVMLGINDALADHPILDEDKLSEMQVEEGWRTTLDNIRYTGGKPVKSGAPADWVVQVANWMDEHHHDDWMEPQGEEENGCDPTEEQIAEALEALGLLDPDYTPAE